MTWANKLRQTVAEQPVIVLSLICGAAGPLLVAIARPDTTAHIRPYIDPIYSDQPSSSK